MCVCVYLFGEIERWRDKRQRESEKGNEIEENRKREKE